MMETLNHAFHFETLVWHWPIAIYLFVLGVSSGSMCLALTIKHFEPDKESISKNPLVISAAILAASMVALGLIILVIDLSKPLDFWKVLVYQFANPTSVMGRGVTLFIVYQVFTFAWILTVFNKEILAIINKFINNQTLNKFINTTADLLARFSKPIEISLLVLSILLGVYTGFLLSVLVSYPLLNQPILPLLFLASGLSSGISATVIFSIIVFSAHSYTKGMSLSHRLETPIVVCELILLMMLIFGMTFGLAAEQEAIRVAIAESFWAYVFWIGVIFIGIICPLALTFFASDTLKHQKSFIIGQALLTLVGVMSLRMFILYAGQMVIA